MSQNNVSTQLQKAIEMKGTVQEFAAILTGKMSVLCDNLEQSVRAGFPEDIAATYHARYYTPDNEIITALSKKMLTEHVDFLDKVIDDLRRAAGRN